MSRIEMPQATGRENEIFEGYAEEYFRELTLGAAESEGARFFPRENFVIDARNRIVEIREPIDRETGNPLKIGTEFFPVRNDSENDWPSEMTGPYFELENRIWSGTLPDEGMPEEPFMPAFGGRVCFTSINIIETAEGQFLSLQILPENEQRYGGRQKYAGYSKLAGPELVRGIEKPDIKKVVQGAMKKERLIVKPAEDASEKAQLISGLERVPTGLWTVRFTSPKGRPTETRHCHLYRDSDAGTLEAMAIRKQALFGNLEDFQPEIRMEKDMKRANALVSLGQLKKTSEGSALPLTKLYYDNIEVADLASLPAEYQNMFELKDGKWFLKELREVPALRGFLELEQRVVDQMPGSLEAPLEKALGDKFEQVVGELLNIKTDKRAAPAPLLPTCEEIIEFVDGRSENLTVKTQKQVGEKITIGKGEFLRIPVPDRVMLDKLIKDQSEIFKAWVQNYKSDEVVIKPDFIGSDGTLYEAKFNSNTKAAAGDNDQLFRMALFRLLEDKASPRPIKYLTLEGDTGVDPIFSDITYLKITDIKEWREMIEKDDLLKAFKQWRKDYAHETGK